MDYFPREQLHASLSLADVHLISMRREMTGIVVPGKLYGVMASGRPAVFVGPEHCETADTIRDSGGGLTDPLGRDRRAWFPPWKTWRATRSGPRRWGIAAGRRSSPGSSARAAVPAGAGPSASFWATPG